jgi:hypothetical protein
MIIPASDQLFVLDSFQAIVDCFRRVPAAMPCQATSQTRPNCTEYREDRVRLTFFTHHPHITRMRVVHGKSGD